MQKQTHALPALLSFFIPGLGQLVKGQIIKAVIIWVIVGVASFFFWWTYIIPFIVWAWNIYDAYTDN